MFRSAGAPALIFLGLAALPALAAADERFRCGSQLVSSDMSPARLIQLCGEPTSRERHTEDVYARTPSGGTNKVGVSVTEKWRYDRGSNAFPMVVTIVDGVIQSLDRG